MKRENKQRIIAMACLTTKANFSLCVNGIDWCLIQPFHCQRKRARDADA